MTAKVAKKAVAQAQEAERNNLGNKINSEEEQSSVFKIAKQMAKEKQLGCGWNELCEGRKWKCYCTTKESKEKSLKSKVLMVSTRLARL